MTSRREELCAMAITRVWMKRIRSWIMLISILKLAYLTHGHCGGISSNGTKSSNSFCSPTRSLHEFDVHDSHQVQTAASPFRTNSPNNERKVEDRYRPIVQDGLHRSLTPAAALQGRTNIAKQLLQIATANFSEDGDTLLEFKEGIRDTLSKLSDWSSVNLPNVCSWTGVYCNDAGRVETLDLTGMRLNGTVSGIIGSLGYLTELYLSDNLLSGSIPEELGRLSNLERLYLDNNTFSGSLPSSLGNCSKLIVLQVNQNELNGSLPQELGNLQFLEELIASENQLTGSLPVFLSNFSELAVLNLSQNNFQGSIPTELGRLTKLDSLYLLGNQLTGVLPPSLGNCSMLQVLELSQNRINGTIPPELGKLSSLREFYINHNLLIGEVPTSLSKCFDLRNLHLNDNQLTGGIPAGLQFYHLESLELCQNYLTGPIPLVLANWTTILNLFLDTNLLEGEIPHELGNLQNLTFLSLGKNRLTGPIPASLKNCQKLRLLDVGRNNLSGILPNFSNPELVVIKVSQNSFEGEIPSWVWGLKRLQMLDLSSNRFHGSLPTSFRELVAFKLISNGTGEAGSLKAMEDRMFGRIVEAWVKDRLEGFMYIWRVMALMDLSGNQLSGVIPPDVGSLDKVFSLNLSRNGFSGEIPSSLSSMTSLESLDLSRNNLSGIIPETIAEMDQLAVLRLSRNNLSGRIPSPSLDNQANTKFPDTSIFFPGNEGLCGPPSNKSCNSSNSSVIAALVQDTDSEFSFLDDWMSLTGFWIGFGIGYSIMLISLFMSETLRSGLFKLTGLGTRTGEVKVRTAYGAYQYPP